MSPPVALVEWTKYLALVISVITAARALFHGGTKLALDVAILRAANSNLK